MSWRDDCDDVHLTDEEMEASRLVPPIQDVLAGAIWKCHPPLLPSLSDRRRGSFGLSTCFLGTLTSASQVVPDNLSSVLSKLWH